MPFNILSQKTKNFLKYLRGLKIFSFFPFKNLICNLVHKFEEHLQVLFYITKDSSLLSRNKRSLRIFCFNLNILLVRETLSKLLITI